MPRDGALSDSGEPQLQARHISEVQGRAVVGAEAERGWAGANPDDGGESGPGGSGPENPMSSSARAPWEAFLGSAVGRRFRRRANPPIRFGKRIVTRVCPRFARPPTPSGGIGKGRRTMRTKKAELSSVEEDETDPSPPRRRHGARQAVTGDLSRRD
jgi:hypothetical protein